MRRHSSLLPVPPPGCRQPASALRAEAVRHQYQLGAQVCTMGSRQERRPQAAFRTDNLGVWNLLLEEVEGASLSL